MGPPCTARTVVTSILPVQRPEKRARTISSFVARPRESIVHPHSIDKSVTVYLRRTPFRKVPPSSPFVLLTAPDKPIVLRQDDRTGCAFVLLVKDTLS